MSKVKGRGGFLMKDGVAQNYIKSYTYSESEGSVHGQKQSDINVDVYIDSVSLPYRHGDEFNVVLGHDDVAWTIDAGSCRVESASMPFVGGDSVVQTLSLIGRTKATIA